MHLEIATHTLKFHNISEDLSLLCLVGWLDGGWLDGWMVGWLDGG